MEPKKLPENVAAKVDEWLGPNCTIHFWEQDGTFFIVAHSPRAQNNIYCLRIFPIGDELQLSQDNILYT